MCGVFGIWGHPEAARLSYLGLHALQHRGQESAGIVSTDGRQLFIHKDMGLVPDVFPQRALESLPGHGAIGHVRYSTAGGSHIRNAQPFAVDYSGGSVAVAHNGTLTNARELRDRLEADGSIFSSNSDTEVVVHLFACSDRPSVEGRVTDALERTRGAWSLLFLTERGMIAVRDPHGFRPLVLARLPVPGRDEPAWVVASEDAPLNLIGARFEREIEPGELLTIDDGGLSSRSISSAPRSFCVFEYVYFARPDSTLEGRSVYQTRQALGRALASEHPVDCDVVIPVPDSGVPAAMGYADLLDRPFEYGIIRNHYVGRTFIEPQQTIRHFGVKLKFNTVAPVLEGKRVVVVDDSIVRGTTVKKIVTMLRAAGAAHVHVRISSPPTAWPCYYGIDTPSRRDLIAASQSVEQTRDFIDASSLEYLSLEGMMKAVRAQADTRPLGLCGACFSGEYPVTVDETVPPRLLRLVRV